MEISLAEWVFVGGHAIYDFDSSAAEMPVKFQSDTIIISWQPISSLRDFTRFGVKTSYRLVHRGSG